MEETTVAAAPAPAPGLPARPVAQVVCGAGLLAGIVAAYVLLALTPSMLAHHALLLEALAGSTVAIVTGGAFARIGVDPLVLVVVAPLASVVLYDLFYWWAGRLWGDRLVQVYSRGNPRRARWLAKAEAVVRRRGVWALVAAYYLPIPNIVVQAFCGISGMSLGLFLIGDVAGTLLWEALLVGLGWGLGQHGVDVAKQVTHYALWVTVAVVVVAVVVSALRDARVRRAV